MPVYPKLGTDISDADALVGDVKDPKTFYSVAEPRKTGTMPTVAIVAANDNYPAGYHAGNVGGLDAIDVDLATVNIKAGVTIFGKLGTYEQTVGQTESYYGTDNKQTEAAYTDFPNANVIIPLTAKKIATGTYQRVSTCTARILYNGVEKAVIAGVGGLHWDGDGLGSAAILKYQAKDTDGVPVYDICFIEGCGIWYCTLT